MLPLEQAQAELRRQQRWSSLRQNAMGALITAFFAWMVILAWQDAQLPRIESIAVSDLHIDGPTELCPGDILRTVYNAEITGIGTISLDTAVMFGDMLIDAGNYKRFPVNHAAKFGVSDIWLVPFRVIDPQGNIMSSLQPGVYRRVISIAPSAAFVNRKTLGQVEEIQFTIRGDCP